MSYDGANLRRIKSSVSLSSSRASNLPRFSGKKSTKETLKNRLVEAKIREEVAKRKHKERLYRRKLISKQKKLQEELEYLHFPTMLGFYFDGFFQHHFALNQEWADIFNAVEEEFANRKELDYRETFTEMARRNFWPPKVYGHTAFRGRGLYLDFREVIRDPPRTPPDTNYEGGRDEDDKLDAPELDFTTLEWDGPSGTFKHGHGHGKKGGPYGPDGYPIDDDQDQQYHLGKARIHRFGVVSSSKPFEELTRYDFYFDEDKVNFFLKEHEDPANLYFDTRFNVWRIKRVQLKHNGDWFFHDAEGVFKLKDRKQPPGIYYFDKLWNVWKKREVYGPSVNGLLPKDYYYDELLSEWFRKSGVSSDMYTFDEFGWRAAKRIPLTGPDDFYFDEDIGDFVLKEVGKGREYQYDPNFGAWRKIGAINPRCPRSPKDFYFNDQWGCYKKKDAPRAHFEYDVNNRFFRKKKVLDGPRNPKNWDWNHKKKLWVPKTSTRSNIFTQALHWRPNRDYDKPWLDYLGGYKEHELYPGEKQGVLAITYDGTGGQGPGQGPGQSQSQVPGQSQGQARPLGTSSAYPSTNTPAPPTKTLDQILAENAEWGSEAYKTSGKRIPFDHKGPGYMATATLPASAATPGVDTEGLETTGDAAESLPPKIEEIVDRTIDRKRLRCGNLNGLVNAKELKAFFVSAVACVKPKQKHPRDTDDYFYIQFESDQAAAAAFRTMQHVDIKGQKIELAYPRRYQK